MDGLLTDAQHEARKLRLIKRAGDAGAKIAQSESDRTAGLWFCLDENPHTILYWAWFTSEATAAMAWLMSRGMDVS